MTIIQVEAGNGLVPLPGGDIPVVLIFFPALSPEAVES